MEMEIFNKYVLPPAARDFVSTTWLGNVTSGEPSRDVIWDVSRQAERVVSAKLEASKSGKRWVPNGDFSDCACIFSSLLQIDQVKVIKKHNVLTWNQMRRVLAADRKKGSCSSYEEGIWAVRNGGYCLSTGAKLVELSHKNGFSSAEGRWALYGYAYDNRDVAEYMQMLG